MPPWDARWPHVFTGRQVVTDMRMLLEGNMQWVLQQPTSWVEPNEQALQQFNGQGQDFLMMRSSDPDDEK